MQRGSSKFGPRLDDELKKDTEGLVRSGHDTRVEEWRGSEPSGEDQPVAALRPDLDASDRDGPDAAIEQRSDLARYLGRLSYPVGRDELLAVLSGRHAPDHWIGSVAALPASVVITNLKDLWERVGGRITEPGS